MQHVTSTAWEQYAISCKPGRAPHLELVVKHAQLRQWAELCAISEAACDDGGAQAVHVEEAVKQRQRALEPAHTSRR
jgi:hypothetical protein